MKCFETDSDITICPHIVLDILRSVDKLSCKKKHDHCPAYGDSPSSILKIYPCIYLEFLQISYYFSFECLLQTDAKLERYTRTNK